MSNVNTNLIFYSKSCTTCYKLLSLLEEHELLSYFKLVCIDGNYDKLPPQIKAVPTMLMKSINRPLGPEDSFKCVQSLIQMKKNKTKKMDETTELDDFVDLELTRFSDIYTFLENDDPLQQAFFKYKDEKKHAIHTAPLEDKLNNKEQSKRIKEMEAERYDQEKKFKIDMRQEQREKVTQSTKHGRR
jgi:predicted thioredoxin/glutaredoxin